MAATARNRTLRDTVLMPVAAVLLVGLVILALATLAGLHEQGLTDDMLASSRTYVLGQFPLQLETASHWVAALAELELYGLDRSYIEGYGGAVEGVDRQAAQRVIEEAFPRPENLAIVMIGDAAKIRAVAARYGPVTEIPLSAPDFAAPPAPRPVR